MIDSIVMHDRIVVNASTHRNCVAAPYWDNAAMHKSPPADTVLARVMRRFALHNGLGQLSDNELARRMKEAGSPIAQSTITRLRLGTSGEPSREIAERLAAFFGLTVPQIRGEDPLPWDAKAGAAGETYFEITELERDLVLAFRNILPKAQAQFFDEITAQAKEQQEFVLDVLRKHNIPVSGIAPAERTNNIPAAPARTTRLRGDDPAAKTLTDILRAKVLAGSGRRIEPSPAPKKTKKG